MADYKYLISADKAGVTTYYTANHDGIIEAIGTVADWSKGFDDISLSAINNDTYGTLKDCKVWINSNTVKSANEETTGEGLLWTEAATAINTEGYAHLIGLTASDSGNVKYALSFTESNYGGDTYLVRGEGTLASSTSLIPATAEERTTAGITIDEDLMANAFDNNADTKTSIKDPTLGKDGLYHHIITLDFDDTHAAKLRKYNIVPADSCRKPMNIKFEVYDSDSRKWVTLDDTTIRMTKNTDRKFDNTYTATKYRWDFAFDKNAFGDDPSRTLDITSLNVFAETTGTTWNKISKDDIKEKGMTSGVLNAITQAQFDEIFEQTELNVMAYIPSGGYITNLVASLPENTPPVVSELIASRDITHDYDVTLRFNVKDSDGDTNLGFRIEVNGEEAIPLTPIETAPNEDGSFDVEVVVPNKYFVIDSTDTDGDGSVSTKNNMVIYGVDSLGAAGRSEYTITKLDKLPSYTGKLVDNVFSFTVTDIDKDVVDYEIKLNGKTIKTRYGSKAPYEDLIKMDSTIINIGGENTLEIRLSDSVGGTYVDTITFMGEYFGLLFADSSANYITDDIGRFLKEIDFGTIITGSTSKTIPVMVINKTNHAVSDVTIVSPKDINGYDKYVKGAKNHVNGDVYLQLSADDSFADESSFYSLNLGTLASNEKKVFYTRIESVNLLTDPGSLTGVTTGTAEH